MAWAEHGQEAKRRSASLMIFRAVQDLKHSRPFIVR